MSEATQQASGWTISLHYGGIYRFEHVPLEAAKAKAGDPSDIYAVEVINWTYASEPGAKPTKSGARQQDHTQVHLNTYFAFGFPAALALANHIELGSLAGEIAQDVVAIRLATDEEAEHFLAADKVLLPEDVHPPVLTFDEVARYAVEDAAGEPAEDAVAI